MSRKILAGAATIAIAALAPQMPAMAQGSPAIIVSVPAPQRADQPKTGVNPARQLVANVFVETYDLDLRTEYGRDILDNRIAAAADLACDRLDMVESSGVGSGMNPDAGNCRHLARKSAEPSVRNAILLDRG